MSKYIVLAVLLLFVLLILKDVLLRVTSKTIGTSKAVVTNIMTSSC